MIKNIFKKIILNPLGIFFLTTILYMFKKRTVIGNECIDSDTVDKVRSDSGKSCIIKAQTYLAESFDLSIIVPCYNCKKFFMSCFNSLIEQNTHYNIEFIFVDDGSTDGTGELLDDISSRYQNIKIIHQMNQGPSIARNNAIKISSGKYITFVDSDDYIENPFLIDNLLNLIESLDAGEKRIIVEYNFTKVKTHTKYKKRITKSKKCSPLDLKGYACGKIYSSKLFSVVNFPPRYLYEDTVNSLVLFYLADELYKTDESGYVYVLHEEGQTRKFDGNNAAIDTFYVTQSLLNDAFELGLIRNNELYINSFLRQVACNYMRTKGLKKEIKIFIFYKTCLLIEKCSFYEKHIKLKYFHLYKSLKQFDYSYYTTACSLINKL